MTYMAKEEGQCGGGGGETRDRLIDMEREEEVLPAAMMP